MVPSMDERFKIYVERLRGGKVEHFSFVVPKKFLDASDLDFLDPVKIEGKAYLAEDELVIQASAEAQLMIPCQICNEPTLVQITVPEILALYPHEEVKSGIFDLAPLIREEILLQVPQFVECHGGKCPERTNYSSYMNREEEGYRPFKEL